jgi:hypothetical protein
VGGEDPWRSRPGPFCDGDVEESSASDFAVGVVWLEGWAASGRRYVRGGITAEGVE